MGSLAIVVGLGNPGERYRFTRHNLGFWVVDQLAARTGATLRADGDLRRYAWTASVRWDDRPVLLAKPRTYMNRSGRAVAALLHGGGPAEKSLIVVYDDADLEFGRIRIREEGGAGGHNGIRSLIEVLGHGNFARVRLGVRGEKRDGEELADYVLSEFAPNEREPAAVLARLGAEAVRFLVEHGVAQAMNRWNGIRVPTSETECDDNG
ncbi:MAG TPA: aminoacyl-tRNA hydrolase [Candidatus Polarisedimenticolaceae bacterium]|nr:aminoacyl-tRNA hydrolase [Candidatus Polarisedimenticolaceae bacterium]